ncbi:MAG: quinone oxidoreductase family protein [Persicimonas sp.]
MSGVICIHETGGPEVLIYESREARSVGAREARVRQTAVGVNFIDTYHRSGLYPLEELPHGIGMEAAGVVEEVGEQVDHLEPGDRVAYAGGPPGAYAEERTIEARHLVRLPDGIDETSAAAMMLQGMTVEYLVRRCFRVDASHTVLLHAAAGGVGTLACQWLSHLGATVLGTVSTEEKAEHAAEHGCDHPIIYTREDFSKRVDELTDGRGVDVVYDSVGKETLMGSLDSLARRGMLVAFGNASGAPEPIAPLELSKRGSLFLTRPSLMDYIATREELEESASALFEVVESGAVSIEVGHTWPLEEAAEAHRALEARETTGSVVLLP